MNEQNVSYACNGILFRLKREGNSDTCYITDEPWQHYAKWSKPVTKGQLFYASSYMKYAELSNT